MLKLPASPDEVLREVIVPALGLLPTKMDTPEARVLLLAILMQESGLAHRRQQPAGPAKGLAQFEPIAVLDVLARFQLMRSVCVQRGIRQPVDPQEVHAALEHDDVLAAALARVRLWLHPASLPAVGATDEAWQYYVECWKPGKPRPEKWPNNYARALACACSKPAGVPSE